MASHIVFRESFVYKISTSISNEAASALMCGGATVFNVLDMFSVKPTERVGIVGVGGLGHLAIKFAAKWGCELIVFSGTESKEEEVISWGATQFHVTKDRDKLEDVTPIDHLMVTQQLHWPLYLSIMASFGTIYPLTFAEGDLKVPYLPFMTSGLRIQASIVAPRVVCNRMLSFAAFHGIGAAIQKYELDVIGIEQAMDDLREGKIRYKAVLSASDQEEAREPL